MSQIKIDLINCRVAQRDILEYQKKVEIIHNEIHSKANDKDDFLGWLELPTNYDKREFSKIKKAAQKIRKESDILLVIGIRRIIFRC